jgi:hypothetical protein
MQPLLGVDDMDKLTHKDFSTLIKALELAADIINSVEVEHFATRTARLKGFVPDRRRINDVLALYSANQNKE